jgi:hypothetical protein
MEYFYMCLVYNNQQKVPISNPNNFKNIFEARVFACKHSTLRWFDNKYFSNHVRIFKIPFGEDVVMYDDNTLYTINLWLTYSETRYNRKTLAVSIIQKFYKAHYKKKIKTIIFLQRALRKAISNPYTQLCERRLINEFYNLN